MRTLSSNMAWKRDNLRVSLSSAPSIEETGLDFSLYGEGLPFVTPHDPLRKTTSMPSESFLQALSSPEVPSGGPSPGETYFNALEALPKQNNGRKEGGLRKRNARLRRHTSIDDNSSNGGEAGGEQSTSNYGGEQNWEKRKDARGTRKLLANGTIPLTGIEEENATEEDEFGDSPDGKLVHNVKLGGERGSGRSSDTVPEFFEMNSNKESANESLRGTSPGEAEALLKASTTEVRDARAYFGKSGLKPNSSKSGSDLVGNLHAEPTAGMVPGNSDGLQSASSGIEARNRWRRLKHTLAFAHHMSENLRSASTDFLENTGEERTAEEHNVKGDGASKTGAAAFEGARGPSRGQLRAKGRKGMEGMLVRQDKGIICLVQDFYVACLKMPIAQFFVGVFLAPIALGLLFTPIYLLDKGGLSFNGASVSGENTSVGRVAAAKQNISALMNVFLYALSLSTTFGGSPVAALSPYCLCVANVHTLLGQFLFVFLSGAIFARMSQPSHPIRCSKTAIIRRDDFTSLPAEAPTEKPKVFAVRLVLTGPPPCELVDAKICLTFRIFIKLPSGSMFCSTQDLDLVRPEVSYLRYGILVRHVIDSKSPLCGHTMQSLLDGDASFSLTIMGLERASMQPIFHLEDYFVCDGDVAWDADYIDFIHINKYGHRVLDHSKIDFIKVTEETKMAGCWKHKTQLPQEKEREKTPPSDDQSTVKGCSVGGLSKSKVWGSKSQSFTRAF